MSAPTETPPAAGDLAGRIALLGLRSDDRSSFLRGPAEAPPKIRWALHNGSSHWTSETGVDLEADGRLVDLGDRAIGESDEEYLGIEGHVADVLARGARPLVLGGDHAVTYPALRAVAAQGGPVDILHFDAHSDLYDRFEGSPYSHACPFARIMEEGLARRLVQVGVRTTNARQKAQAERFGVEVHEMRGFDVARFEPRFDGPLYVSFDMDSLDPAFAPGVSHHEPGGLSVRDVLDILHRVEAPIVGADVVEFNPRRDVHDMTAAVAAKMVRELAALMLLNGLPSAPVRA
ncbi:MAG: agmatinase [Acidobacteriota bacterium]